MASKNSTLVVNNKNDKRLKAYADSLALYNQGMRDRANLMKTVESYGVDKKAVSYFANKKYFKPINGIKPEKEMSIEPSGGGYNKSDSGMLNFNTYKRSDGSEIKTEKGSITDKNLSKNALLYKKPVRRVIYQEPITRGENRQIPGIGTNIQPIRIENTSSAPSILPSIAYDKQKPIMAENTTIPQRTYSPEPPKYFEGKYQGKVTKKINPGWQEWNDSKKSNSVQKYAGGISATQYGQAGAGFAGTAGTLLATEDKESDQNYASNMLSMAGKGASIGSALGPWGMAAGAVVGGIGGYFLSDSQADKQRLAKTSAEINKTTSQIYDQSNQVKAKYDMKYDANSRVPGLNKGTSKFNKVNAVVAPEETIMDGQTGELNVVPGTYNPSNPDTVPANLTPGTSVFSKEKSQTLPGGQSTPADVMQRATKVQKHSDDVLSSTNRYGRLDKLTAELNNRNIAKQAENLNKFNDIVNIGEKQDTRQVPGYAKGTSDIKEYYVLDKWNKPMSVSVSGLSDEEIAKRGYKSRDLSVEEAAGLTSGGRKMPSWYRKYQPDTNALSDSATAQFAKDKFENTGWYTQVPVTQNNETPNKPILNQSKAVNSQLAPNVPSVPNNALNSPVGTSTRTQTVVSNPTQPRQTASVSNPENVDPSTGRAFANMPTPSQPETTGGQQQLSYLNQPQYGIKTADMPGIDIASIQSKVQAGMNEGTSSGANQPAGGFDYLGAISGIGNKVASLAPILYNARNSAPEVESAMYPDYININQRYNMAPELAEATRQRNIARYNNAAINSNTGSGMALNAALYGEGMRTTSDIMNKAQLANNTYRQNYADRYNQYAVNKTAEDRRIADVNARNRAAARNFGAKNAEMISQYAQTQQLQQNQAYADLLNSNIWNAYSSAVDANTKNQLNSLLSSYRSRYGIR